jgi:hypothetical protein
MKTVNIIILVVLALCCVGLLIDWGISFKRECVPKQQLECGTNSTCIQHFNNYDRTCGDFGVYWAGLMAICVLSFLIFGYVWYR